MPRRSRSRTSKVKQPVDDGRPVTHGSRALFPPLASTPNSVSGANRPPVREFLPETNGTSADVEAHGLLRQDAEQMALPMGNNGYSSVRSLQSPRESFYDDDNSEDDFENMTLFNPDGTRSANIRNTIHTALHTEIFDSVATLQQAMPNGKLRRRRNRNSRKGKHGKRAQSVGMTLSKSQSSTLPRVPYGTPQKPKFVARMNQGGNSRTGSIREQTTAMLRQSANLTSKALNRDKKRRQQMGDLDGHLTTNNPPHIRGVAETEYTLYSEKEVNKANRRRNGQNDENINNSEDNSDNNNNINNNTGENEIIPSMSQLAAEGDMMKSKNTCMACWSKGTGATCAFHREEFTDEESKQGRTMCSNWGVITLYNRYRSEDIQEVQNQVVPSSKYDRRTGRFITSYECVHPIYRALDKRIEELNKAYFVRHRVRQWFTSLKEIVRVGRVGADTPQPEVLQLRCTIANGGAVKRYTMEESTIKAKPLPPNPNVIFIQKTINDQSVKLVITSISKPLALYRAYPYKVPEPIITPVPYPIPNNTPIPPRDTEANNWMTINKGEEDPVGFMVQEWIAGIFDLAFNALPERIPKKPVEDLLEASAADSLGSLRPKTRTGKLITTNFSLFSRQERPPQNMAVGGLPPLVLLHRYVSTFLPAQYGGFVIAKQRTTAPQKHPPRTEAHVFGPEMKIFIEALRIGEGFREDVMDKDGAIEYKSNEEIPLEFNQRSIQKLFSSLHLSTTFLRDGLLLALPENRTFIPPHVRVLMNNDALAKSLDFFAPPAIRPDPENPYPTFHPPISGLPKRFQFPSYSRLSTDPIDFMGFNQLQIPMPFPPCKTRDIISILNDRKMPTIMLSASAPCPPADRHYRCANRPEQTGEKHDTGYRTSAKVPVWVANTSTYKSSFTPTVDVAVPNKAAVQRSITSTADRNYPFRVPSVRENSGTDNHHLLNAAEATANKACVFSFLGRQNPGTWGSGGKFKGELGELEGNANRSFAWSQTGEIMMFHTDDGVPYWYNRRTNETFWEKPIDGIDHYSDGDTDDEDSDFVDEELIKPTLPPALQASVSNETMRSYMLSNGNAQILKPPPSIASKKDRDSPNKAKGAPILLWKDGSEVPPGGLGTDQFDEEFASIKLPQIGDAPSGEVIPTPTPDAVPLAMQNANIKTVATIGKPKKKLQFADDFDTHAPAGEGRIFKKPESKKPGVAGKLVSSTPALPTKYLEGVFSRKVAKQHVDYLPNEPNINVSGAIGVVKPPSLSDGDRDPWGKGASTTDMFISDLAAEASLYAKRSPLEIDMDGYKLDRSEAEKQKELTKQQKRDELRDKMFSWARHGKYKELERAFDAFVDDIDVDWVDESGCTLLHIAAQNNNKRICKLILRKGCDINLQNLAGQTVLHYCYAYGFQELGEYLIQKGADDSIVNADGLTCYEGLSQEDMDGTAI